eukprot:scaffold4806_cov363-Prasinococcus_capsulatus_cf.AAC.2
MPGTVHVPAPYQFQCSGRCYGSDSRMGSASPPCDTRYWTQDCDAGDLQGLPGSAIDPLLPPFCATAVLLPPLCLVVHLSALVSMDVRWGCRRAAWSVSSASNTCTLYPHEESASTSASCCSRSLSSNPTRIPCKARSSSAHSAATVVSRAVRQLLTCRSFAQSVRSLFVRACEAHPAILPSDITVHSGRGLAPHSAKAGPAQAHLRSPGR